MPRGVSTNRVRNNGLSLCSWVPGLALKGHPGTTAALQVNA